MTLQVTAKIAEGWHLYSLKKQEDGPIATSIEVPPAQDFYLDGNIVAPRPLTRHDEFYGMDIAFYLDDVTFAVPVVVSKAASGGNRSLVVTARYQVCDNLQCLPPRTERLEHALLIKDR